MVHFSASAGIGRLRGMRILVAEDEWLAADTLSILLEEEGAEVIGPFPSNARCIDALRNSRVDFAVVDIRLRDGFADLLVEKLVAAGVPYGIITAYEHLPTNAFDKASAVVRKPITKQALLDLLLLPR